MRFKPYTKSNPTRFALESWGEGDYRILDGDREVGRLWKKEHYFNLRRVIRYFTWEIWLGEVRSGGFDTRGEALRWLEHEAVAQDWSGHPAAPVSDAELARLIAEDEGAGPNPLVGLHQGGEN